MKIFQDFFSEEFQTSQDLRFFSIFTEFRYYGSDLGAIYRLCQEWILLNKTEHLMIIMIRLGVDKNRNH